MTVGAGATLQCSFGAAPGTLNVLPANRVLTQGVPAATILDFAPMVNITPFGMCNSPSNPMVIAATAAALGVFTPQPCIPAPVAPWVPGAPTTMVGVAPALTNTSKCMCMWAGVIQVANPVATTVQAG